MLVPEESINELGKRKDIEILQVLCFQESVLLNEKMKMIPVTIKTLDISVTDQGSWPP